MKFHGNIMLELQLNIQTGQTADSPIFDEDFSDGRRSPNTHYNPNMDLFMNLHSYISPGRIP